MEMVRRLRGIGEIEAADRILDLETIVKMHEYADELLDKKAERYVEYWRKKNGKSDLCYPGRVTIYQDFFELLEENERLREELNGVYKLEKPL